MLLELVSTLILLRWFNDLDPFITDSVEFDPITLHSRKKGGKGGFMPDDHGKGNLEIWRVQKRELVIVREEMRGMFFDNNCYVIKYTATHKKGGVVYFWQVIRDKIC